ARSLTITGLFLAAFATTALILGHSAEKPLEITAERLTKIVATRAPEVEKEAAKTRAAEKKKHEEEAESRRMKGKAGKIGRADATAKDTVIPKGDKDLLRDKVAHKGILGVIGNQRPAGSGLSKLFAANTGEIDQALNGLAGAKLAVGHGSGGL